jgi:transcription-repair coupling factor (superfamily II helicase)
MLLPFVRSLFADLEASEPLERVRLHLAAGAGRRCVSGLTATARAFTLPYLAAASSATTILLVADNKAAESLHAAVTAACHLTAALSPAEVLTLPAHDVLPFENLSAHPEILEKRAATLWKLATGSCRLLIAPIEAACLRLFAPDYYAGLALQLKRGEEYLPESLLEHLLSVGYTKVDVVEMPGQVTIRGGIMDVYSPEADRPVRIDFFGDEIESIRKFDPETQRSSTTLESALLLPLTETPVTERLLAAVHARLTQSEAESSDLDNVSVFPGWEFFAPVAGASHTLFDLLAARGAKPRILVEEPAMVRNQGERWWSKVEQRHERAGIGSLIRPSDIYITPAELEERIAPLPGLDLDQLGAVDILEPDHNPLPAIEIPTRPTPRFHGSVPALAEELKSLLAQDARILLAVPHQGEVDRLATALQSYGVPYRIGTRAEHAASGTMAEEAQHASSNAPTIVASPIPAGVQFLDLDRATARRLVLFGAQDLVDEADVAARTVPRRSKTSAFLSDFRDLAVGDFVVHVEHGIARYQGLREIEQDGLNVEFMILEFADAARLYIPLTRLDLIQKYRSTETGAAPELNKLGNAQWAKTKSRVKKVMEDMADELLKLYAARKAAEGFAFSPDGALQREFDDAFDFTETDDQLTAISDIKRDMESTQPMDRLLCGDVGYGKTEVAMRAAFKAVQDSRQVAVLTPTTILAFQHFETFKRRFANTPVVIEMLSRFRTAKEQKAIVERTAQGKVDILIGTHRLLSQDVKFQDLGLLIVDEEQRFGVRHKERLKQLRATMDVLSMSATPIPRTLHMSLAGLRDMSLIETPPKDRMAIQTVVARFDPKLVRTAIEVELERGGQVYFVHNRVETIYDIASLVREQVPSARVVVAHGQMSEAELEKVMLAFMGHQFDVLVATTIIENGLDIPLANTILINRADRHGLSELYQLRGRVGRSNRRAYAYLLIPGEKELTDIARRRLAALKEFSDLGAGFKIAALDLELRGAGNLLGGQQSGHIEAIGFEMYTTMLEEAVRKLKGESSPDHVSVQINLGIALRIDANYIAEENQRLRMYKRIASAESERALADVRAELLDRYGPLPETVEHLLAAAALRLECQRAGISQLDRKRAVSPTSLSAPRSKAASREFLHLRFAQSTTADPVQIAQLVAKQSNRGALFTPQGVLHWPISASKPADLINEATSLVQSIKTPPNAG